MLLLSTTAAAEDRVAAARKRAGETVRELFRAAGVDYPADELYIRAFKHEKVVEAWAGKKGKPLVKVKEWPFCYASGNLGPKRRQGDLQVPEGFYRVVHFNPRSNFHLSLGVDYPNASDRILGEKGKLGGDIYIHGSCASIGCIAIEDGPIEELYLMALDAKTRPIRTDIFPRKLDEAGMAELAKGHGEALVAFWKQLQPGYLYFEEHKRPPPFSVDPKTGAYRVGKARAAQR